MEEKRIKPPVSSSTVQLFVAGFPPKVNPILKSSLTFTYIMNPQQPEPDLPLPPLPSLRSQRRIAIAVDLSDESAHAVKWAVNNYLRPGDAVILLHVRSTSVLYGADWGSIKCHINEPLDESDQQKLEDDFDNFTTRKTNSLAQPLVEAQISFKIHIVKDHDMKDRLCLEVERLGLSAVIMRIKGFGASRRNSKVRLGSVSDYCVRHCICPVVVVRYSDDDGNDNGVGIKEVELHPLPEEDQEYHDASDDQKDA